MNLIERAKNICLTPKTEWSVIAGEITPAAGLITGYVLPLAGVAAVAGLIGGSLVGLTMPFLGGTYRTPLATGLALAVYGVVTAVVGVFLISLIIDGLAPTFGAQKNSAQALKVAVYSFTPAWIAGVFQILPTLGILALLGALYGLYLLYLGLPRLMHCPEDKAVGYTVVVVLCAIVISVVLGAVGGTIAGMGMFGSRPLAGAIGGAAAAGAAASTVNVDPNSALGRLQQLGQGIEESARKAEAAEKAGDQAGQVAAAMEGLGAILGGGTRVEPLDIDLLKPHVPETLGGLQRTSSKAEKSGMGIIMVSKAEATYGEGGARQVSLEITDTGGVSGLMGLAGWMGVQAAREDADGFERTETVDGRMTHVKASKSGGNEFSVVVGERFMVSAKSRVLDVNALEAAVSGLDLGRLESMKGVGIK